MVIKKTDAMKRSARKPKEEMLSAYTEALQQQPDLGEAQLNPEKIVEDKKAKSAVQVAEALSAAGVSKEIYALKTEIGRMLSELADKLDQQVGRFTDVQKAIAVKEQELREVYEIDKAAASLAALLEAQNQRRADFENEITGKKDALETEIRATRERWDKERKEWELRVKEQETAALQKREREKAEFEYTFQRDQQQAMDKLNDDKARLEKGLQTQKETLEKEWAERARVLKAAEAELNELRARAVKFPAELETAVGKAVKETTEKLTVAASANLALVKKEFEGERNVQNARIESLQAAVQQQTEQITKLAKQHELAYEKVQNIAVKAIEGSGNLKTVSAFQDMLADQLKKQARDDK